MNSSNGLRGANGPLSFFRVFDVAFLVPGTLVYLVPLVTARTSLLVESPGQSFFNNLLEHDTVIAQTATLVAGVVILFVTGIVCHAIARLVLAVLPRQHSKCGLVDVPDICLYLWNLASLAWNCSVALVLGTILRWNLDAWTGILLLVALLLVWQGRDFRAGYRYCQGSE